MNKVIDNLKGAIFDMDGLLVNSEHLYFKANILAAGEMNVPLPKDSYIQVAGASEKGVKEYYRKYFASDEAVTNFVHRTDEIALDLVNNGELQLQPGVLNVLQSFKENNIEMAIASSNYRPTINLFLQKVGINQFFDEVTSGEDVSTHKPDPEVYLKAQSKINIPKENLLIFEDSLYGVKAGIAANIHVCFVPDKTFSSVHKLDNPVDGVTELKQIDDILKMI